MKEIISSGGLGSMRYVSSVRTNLGPIRNDVNAAYDLASHDVSIINWLVDDMPVLASATGAAFLQKDIHDVVFISLRYPGGVMANVQASWLNPKKVRQMTVVGSQRMMTWDDIELSSPVAVYDKGADATQEYSDYGEFLRVAMWDGDVRLPKVHLDEPLKLQDRHFIEAIQGKAVERSGGAFGLGVVRVLEAIAGSLALDGRPVEVRRCPSSPGLDQAWREQFRTEMQAVNLDTRVR
jgi:predicted dehydrogenase